MNDLPFFKYNPDAYQLGIIKQVSTHCPCCNQKREYTYVGPFFSPEAAEGLCPWCIKDGSAANKFEGEFQDAASCEAVEQEEYLDELTHKTPGYNGIQQEPWLSHCGDFCAFKGPVSWKEISSLKEELAPDLDQVKEDYDFSQQDLEDCLVENSSYQGYLFQCLHCHTHRLAIDAD